MKYYNITKRYMVVFPVGGYDGIRMEEKATSAMEDPNRSEASKQSEFIHWS